MLRYNPTADGIRLTGPHCLEQLHAHLKDLIQIHLEKECATLSGLLFLKELQYASGENKEERSSMHFTLNAKEVSAAAKGKTATLFLTCTVSTLKEPE